jgi:DNA-binding NarL/FixJ family response regulator
LLEEARGLFAQFEMRLDLARCEQLLAGLGRAEAPGGLSAREVEVLRLIARGLTNREIAAQLVISERTVANHLSHIFDKIAVENRSGATAFAFRSGIARPEGQ